MKVWQFENLWNGAGWLTPGFVTTDDEGRIVGVSETAPDGSFSAERVAGHALPGLVNAHSHAFQFAMAGMAEYAAATSGDDDFWSWREAMYALALSMEPEDVEAVARMLYTEMVRHGYTTVVEFHYLHHDRDGQPYADLAEMGRRLASAARQAGIALVLVPIFYQRGGFDRPANPRQRRFLSADAEAYGRLVEASQAAMRQEPRASVGIGFHSLRAVPPASIARVLKDWSNESMPLHIHISEQMAEVEVCEAVLGARPVAWLLENHPVGRRWSLVHATHINEDECSQLAASGAVSVLCPSTEGNLGDGFFPLRDYIRAGGRWAIGTDSHVGVSPLEELRWLDYGQRMRLQKRNGLNLNAGQDGGEILMRAALAGGRTAAGFGLDQDSTMLERMPGFVPGQPFDAVVFDAGAPLLAGNRSRLLSRIVYTADASHMLGTITAGQWRVQRGHHVNGAAARELFFAALQRLAARA